MATALLTVQGNTAPAIELTLERDGQPINLTDATSVDLVIQNKKTGQVVNSGHQNCTITDATGGVVEYPQTHGDFGVGTYMADVVITYSDTTVETVYEQAKIISRRKVPYNPIS